MRIGVLGTGNVGQDARQRAAAQRSRGAAGLAHRRQSRGRRVGGGVGGPASEGTFADAAGFGELLVNATAGAASLEALEMAGAEQLAGKVLIDVANPLDFSHGMPPTLTVCNDDSLGEQIQRALPDVRVVKTLNTVTAAVMVDPSLVERRAHDLRRGRRRDREGGGGRAAAGARLARGLDPRPR